MRVVERSELLAIDDRVVARPAIGPGGIDIPAGRADEEVVAVPAHQNVGLAPQRAQFVVAFAAEERSISPDLVVAIAAAQHVVAELANDDVVAGTAEDVIVAFGAPQVVIAAAAVYGDVGPDIVGADEHVVARTEIELGGLELGRRQERDLAVEVHHVDPVMCSAETSPSNRHEGVATRPGPA